jgi:hypothetical protein
MKLQQAINNVIDEDAFYELVADAYEVYKGAGGSALSIDDYLRLHRIKAMPWHVAKKEKELKDKLKASNDTIKEKVIEYFFKQRNK